MRRVPEGNFRNTPGMEGTMASIIDQILEEKKKQNAVILAHLYVDGEVQDIADYCGDSYYLSQMAQKTDAETIVFCGVEFMAESAKILNPEKLVLMPDRAADCPMAHMATADDVAAFRATYDDLAVVCYINSTTELKTVSDVCVTSSNAKKVLSNVPNKHILFIPDQNLGGFLAPLFPEKQFHFLDGYCHVHNFMDPAEVEALMAAHPEAKVACHPECNPGIRALADYIGSTTGILKYANETDAKEFIILTEIGVAHRLRLDNPGKTFYFTETRPVCPNMKKVTLEKVLRVLQDHKDPIVVDPEIAEKAKTSLLKMHQWGG